MRRILRHALATLSPLQTGTLVIAAYLILAAANPHGLTF